MDARRGTRTLASLDGRRGRGGVRTRSGGGGRGRSQGAGRGRGEQNVPAPEVVSEPPTWGNVPRRGRMENLRTPEEAENPAANAIGGSGVVPDTTPTQGEVLSNAQVASMFEAQVQVMREMSEMMRSVTQMVQIRPGQGSQVGTEGPSSGEAGRVQLQINEVDKMRKLDPPKFHGDADVSKAHTWIREMTRRLDTLSIPDERRGMVASYFLIDKAYDWWFALGERRNELTWASFERLFMQHFVPQSYRAEKAKEFLTLVQLPDMPVAEYSYKFDELYEYGKMYASDDSSKAERFRQGLIPNVGAPLVSMRIATYDEMREEALQQEQVNKDSKKYWEAHGGRSVTSGTGAAPRPVFSGQKRQRTDGQIPQNRSRWFNSGPRPQGNRGSQQGPKVCYKCGGVGHVMDQCLANGVKCFQCGKVGHKSFDCPQRRGDSQQRSGVSSAASTHTTPRALSGSTSTFTGRGRPPGRPQQQRSQSQTTLTQGRAFALGQQTEPEHPNFVGGPSQSSSLKSHSAQI